jgi:hypothetical protein
LKFIKEHNLDDDAKVSLYKFNVELLNRWSKVYLLFYFNAAVWICGFYFPDAEKPRKGVLLP